MAPQDTPSNTNPQDNQSYILMTEVDRGVGSNSDLAARRCQYEYCRQLDFLPYQCQSCWRRFCAEHRQEDDHRCANKGAWAARNRQRELAKPSIGEGRPLRDVAGTQGRPCASPGCQTVSTSLQPGVHCAACNRDYCLKHRLQEEHNCAKLVPIGARPAGASPGVGVSRQIQGLTDVGRKAWASVLAMSKKHRESRLAAEQGGQGSRSRKKEDEKRAADLRSLKTRAKGDPKLPPEKRVYVYVQAAPETEKAAEESGYFFYSRDWVVGRVLDAAAKSLQVQNVNNQSSEEKDKLRVFHIEKGRLLEFNEKVGTALASGDRIVLLRGVGPAPDPKQT